jgi:beta-glucosidase
VQLYVRDVAARLSRPDKELKGFAKVALAPGETATVTLAIDKTALAYYSRLRRAGQAARGPERR